MSHPPSPEAPTPGSGEDIPTDGRRIRVAGGQLLHRGMVHPGQFHPPDSASSAPLPVEVTGVFRQLQDTAEALSQRLVRLSTDAPATPPLASDSRPLPMHQRRPHRVEPGQVNAKRSVRFGAPGEAVGAPFVIFPPAEAEDAPPEPSGAPGVAPGVMQPPPVFPSGTLAQRPPGITPPPERFQPRHAYAPVGEDGSAARGDRRWGWGLAVVAFALGLAGGWAFQRFSSPAILPTPGTKSDPPAAPAAPAARVPTDPAASARATALVNQALRAEKGGHLARAADLFTEAGKVCPTFPGIHYRLALLNLRQGDKSKSQTLLARSLAAREEVAAVHQLRSALARVENQPELGFAELEEATRADPFNPRYPYYWAEALRRAGRQPEALEKLEDALARTVDPSEESLYRLKLRLVKIELNREDEFAGELLARTHDAITAPPEWLLTAAALDLRRGAYAAAAAYLSRAQQILPAATAAFLFNDQTFLDHAWRPELAPFYAPGSDRVPPAASASVAPETRPRAKAP